MAYTASVTLTRAWLTDALAPTVNPLSCGTRSPGDDTLSLDGEFRVYAGNRIQMVVRSADTLTRPIMFVALTPAQMNQVVAWRGRLLLLRTIGGGRVFGGYLSVARKRLYNTSGDYGLTSTAYDVSVSFTATTFSEAV